MRAPSDARDGSDGRLLCHSMPRVRESRHAVKRYADCAEVLIFFIFRDSETAGHATRAESSRRRCLI